AADRGETALRRRARPGLDRFRILLARLAQVHVDVEKSRRNDQSARIENFQSISRLRVARRSPSRLGDFFDAIAVEQYVHCRVGLRRRIHHAAVLDEKHAKVLYSFLSVDRRLRGCSLGVALGCAEISVVGNVSSSEPPAASKNSSAMRAAMPFVTCSSTHDCGPSATSGVISIPRFSGPGCSTIASGFARFMRSALSWYNKM